MSGKMSVDPYVSDAIRYIWVFENISMCGYVIFKSIIKPCWAVTLSVDECFKEGWF